MLEQVGHQQFKKFSLDHNRKSPVDSHDDDLPPTEILDLSGKQESPSSEKGASDQPIFWSKEELAAKIKEAEAKEKALQTIAFEKVEQATFPDKIKLMNTLWPETKGMKPPSSQIEQGRYGNCYAIAGLDAVKRNQYMFLDLMDKITPRVQAGTVEGWTVRLYDDTIGAEVDVFVKSSELHLPTSMKSGTDGDRVIERAYQTLVNDQVRRKEHGDLEAAGKTFHKMERVVNGENVELLSFEANQGHKALSALLGPSYEKHLARKDQPKLVEALHVIAADQKKQMSERKIVATVYTKQNVPAHQEKIPKWKFWKKPQKDFSPDYVFKAHAYSVASVDVEKGIVQVANPHNTAETHDVDFPTFFKYFSGISYVQKRSSEVNPKLADKTIYH